MRLLGGVAVRLQRRRAAARARPRVQGPRLRGHQEGRERGRPGARGRRLRAARRRSTRCTRASAGCTSTTPTAARSTSSSHSFRMCHEITLGDRLEVEAADGPARRAAADQAPDHRAQREGHPRHGAAAPRPRRRGPRRRRGQRRARSPSCARATGGCGARSPRTSSAAAATSTDYELPDDDRERIGARFDALLEPHRGRAQDAAAGGCARRSASASAGTSCPRRSERDARSSSPPTSTAPRSAGRSSSTPGRTTRPTS